MTHKNTTLHRLIFALTTTLFFSIGTLATESFQEPQQDAQVVLVEKPTPTPPPTATTILNTNTS